MFSMYRFLFESEGNAFSIEQMASLKSPDEINRYASAHLPLVGQGSTRKVFALSPEFVLKLVNPDFDENRGIAQNEEETRLSAIEEAQVALARIKSHGEGFLWVIQERVQPLSSWKVFDSVTGFSSKELAKLLRGNYLDVADFQRRAKPNSQFSNSQLVKALFVLRENGLSFDDLKGYQQWGVTTDGRVVLVDFGATDSVLDEYY